jgi:hypothetical protein
LIENLSPELFPQAQLKEWDVSPCAECLRLLSPRARWRLANTPKSKFAACTFLESSQSPFQVTTFATSKLFFATLTSKLLVIPFIVGKWARNAGAIGLGMSFGIESAMFGDWTLLLFLVLVSLVGVDIFLENIFILKFNFRMLSERKMSEVVLKNDIFQMF